MTRQTRLAYGALAALLLAALLFLGLVVPRWLRTEPGAGAPAQASAAGAATRRIRVRLFYVGEDGRHLQAVEREVPLADTPLDEARQIVQAQLEPAPDGYSSAIPRGTALRAIYLTDRGDALVDLSAEVSRAHPGGSTNELLTVYAIVNALTVNLPAVSGVQILVGGQEVDTLAGHIDLRRPLQQDLGLVMEAPSSGKNTP
jgi:hypothetical protein